MELGRAYSAEPSVPMNEDEEYADISEDDSIPAGSTSDYQSDICITPEDKRPRIDDVTEFDADVDESTDIDDLKTDGDDDEEGDVNEASVEANEGPERNNSSLHQLNKTELCSFPDRDNVSLADRNNRSLNRTNETKPCSIPDGNNLSLHLISKTEPCFDGGIEGGNHATCKVMTDPDINKIDENIQCNQCHEFIPASDIMNHLSKVHPKKDTKFICTDCGKGFNFESGLSLHRINHHGVSLPSNAMPKRRSRVILLCVVCGKSFKHVTPLTVHIQETHLESYHECKICDEPFLNSEMYKLHQQKHDGLDKNQCYICKKTFKRPFNCKEHIIKHKRSFKYKCPKCSKVFLKSPQLAIHSICHIPQVVFKCRVCGKILVSDTDRAQHERTHFMGETSNKCNVCNEWFSNERLQDEHIDKVHFGEEGGLLQSERDIQQFPIEHNVSKMEIECTVCHNVFDRLYFKRVHVEDEQGAFRCIVCPKHFCYESDVVKHVSEHTESEEYNCCVCGLVLLDTNVIMEHLYKHGVQRKKTFSNGKDVNTDPDDKIVAKCPICDKTFHFVSSLESHMRIHTEVVKHSLKCHVCQQDFAEVRDIRNHLKTSHSEEHCSIVNETDRKKRNRCDICLKRFLSYFAVRQHRVLHTGVKPFACDICEKRFVIRSELKFHRLLHMETKPYVCEFCSKSFNKPNSLKEHIMIHKGIKPFLCHLCGKAFVNRQKLHLHTFVHTRETPFNCKVCGRGFRATITRQKHVCTGPPLDLESQGTADLEVSEASMSVIEDAENQISDVVQSDVILDLASASDTQFSQSFDQSAVNQLQQFWPVQ